MKEKGKIVENKSCQCVNIVLEKAWWTHSGRLLKCVFSHI